MRLKQMPKWLKFVMSNVLSITLVLFSIFYRESMGSSTEEKIHWKQQTEMLFVFFYIWYIIEWSIKFLTPPVGAYFDLSFECEANQGKKIPIYLVYRKPFSWLCFIFNK